VAHLHHHHRLRNNDVSKRGETASRAATARSPLVQTFLRHEGRDGHHQTNATNHKKMTGGAGILSRPDEICLSPATRMIVVVVLVVIVVPIAVAKKIDASPAVARYTKNGLGQPSRQSARSGRNRLGAPVSSSSPSSHSSSSSTTAFVLSRPRASLSSSI
jgi:hypothetical protein